MVIKQEADQMMTEYRRRIEEARKLKVVAKIGFFFSFKSIRGFIYSFSVYYSQFLFSEKKGRWASWTIDNGVAALVCFLSFYLRCLLFCGFFCCAQIAVGKDEVINHSKRI